MNDLLKPVLRNFVIIFFDDILVYSPTFYTHLHHLECVFKTMMIGQFFLNESKCLFTQRCLEYLGHIVSGNGVAPEPSKIQAMVDWPMPTTIKSLHGFLGLTGFYRKLIRVTLEGQLPLEQCNSTSIWLSQYTQFGLPLHPPVCHLPADQVWNKATCGTTPTPCYPYFYLARFIIGLHH